MSDLDKKLEDIIDSSVDLDGWIDFEGVVDEIKQAFKDCYWMDTKEAFTHVDGGTRLMTGQEWFNKFQEEISAIYPWSYIEGSNRYTRVLESAKKAAGIE